MATQITWEPDPGHMGLPERRDSARAPGFEAVTSYGLLAPAATPAAVVHRMQSEIAKVMRTPELAVRLATIGAVTVANTPEQFGALIRREQLQYQQIIRRSGIRVE